jgi:hypothetical protein
LGEYDLDCNFAVVNAKNFLDLETVGFRYLLEFPPDGNVVSVGHEISGNLRASPARPTNRDPIHILEARAKK